MLQVNLKDRLALIKSDREKNHQMPHGKRSMPEGWTEISPFVWMREVDRPFIEVPLFFSPHLMRATVPRGDQDNGEFQSVQVSPIPADRIAFFDLETTGLSGGSGTIAFLSTVAHFEGTDLVLRQTFLEDYPGEHDFLVAVISQLANVDWIASYNGATFDVPLLQARCVLNRIAMPLVRHIDVLHDCRRFWGRMVLSCSLTSMEALVLKKERESDIPGALVPRVWLDYVKADVPREDQQALISLVWQHNVQDVASLAELFLVVESAYRRPSNAVVRYAIDPSGLARNLLKMGRSGEAKSILLMVRDQAETFELACGARMRAMRHLASIAWKERNRTLYVETVLAMDDESLYGCVAKAKLCEHFFKDEKSALAWAQKARDIAGKGSQADRRNTQGLDLESLDHRIARLERKIAKKNSLAEL